MTVKELYEYAKKHDALDYEVCGTSISCGPHFDRVKVNPKNKTISMEDSAWGYAKEYYEENGFDLIPKKD